MGKTNTTHKYHQQTSYERRNMGGHYLDWEHQPAVYKIYEGIERMPLQDNMDLPAQDILKALKNRHADQALTHVDLEQLSTILRLTYTFKAKASRGADTYYYRSAASAGALYPTEIYVVTSGIKGLKDGLYHFGIYDHSLCPLRSGDFSGFISGSAIPPLDILPGVTLIFTSIYFRSSCLDLIDRTLGPRGYRYAMMEAGRRGERIYLLASALGLGCCGIGAFYDREAADILGLKKPTQLLYLVAVGKCAPL